MTEDIFLQAQHVETRQDLEVFLEVIPDYLAQNEVRNDQLQAYFKAMCGWVEDMDGYYSNIHESSPEERSRWGMIADMLVAAMIY